MSASMSALPLDLTIDPAVAVLITVCAAALFGVAAFHKLRDPRLFEEIFTAYGVIPVSSRWRFSRLVPLIEAAVAAGVLFAPTRKVAVTAGAFLLLLYAGAIALNLYRGRRDLACGCGGPDERRTIAPWMVGRNLVLTLLLLTSLLPWTSRGLELTDAVTVGFGALTGAVAYLCIDRLLTYATARGGALRASQ
jgi:Methylamine utilisation protein MauE